MTNKTMITGLLGLAAAILVGVGEYLLHYDPLARFTDGGYLFMQGISAQRSSVGHFLGVFGATLYPFGCYHIYLMLRAANEKAAFSAFIIGTIGFIIGTVWIGSRASVSALINLPQTPEIIHLIDLYDQRYETLLMVVRLTTLTLSAIFVWLTLTGRSAYRRWMAIFSPVLILLGCFAIFVVAPSIGKHIMPIALNVAFFVFFLLSLYHVIFPVQRKP